MLWFWQCGMGVCMFFFVNNSLCTVLPAEIHGVFLVITQLAVTLNVYINKFNLSMTSSTVSHHQQLLLLVVVPAGVVAAGGTCCPNILAHRAFTTLNTHSAHNNELLICISNLYNLFNDLSTHTCFVTWNRITNII